MNNAKKKKDILVPLLYILSDILAIELSFLFSYWLRFYSPINQFFGSFAEVPPVYPYFLSSLVVIPVWIFLFNSRKMYSSRRIASVSEDILPVIKVITLGIFFVLSVAFFYRDFSYSRIVFIFIYFSSIIFILFFRFLSFKVELLFYRRGKEIKNVLIVGSNQNAAKIYQELTKSYKFGFKLIGYCSDEKINSEEFNYLGHFKDFRNIVVENNIEIVIAVLSSSDHEKLYDMMEQSEGVNIEFMFMPDILELMNNQIRVRMINGIPFLRMKGIPISGINRVVKRIFDIVFSILFLILISPLVLIIAVLIKIESKGPLFYKQDRIGLEGDIFKVIKFRSMRIDAESESGPVWAKSEDKRVTKIGKFIRKYSIDEIPQFFNVLKGDMSVVGPRPERPFFVNQFKDKIPKYLERHRVKTGVTGWAQVNGLRGNTSLDERIQYDIYYVENWSLILDILIIFKTLKEIFFAKNAY